MYRQSPVKNQPVEPQVDNLNYVIQLGIGVLICYTMYKAVSDTFLLA